MSPTAVQVQTETTTATVNARRTSHHPRLTPDKGQGVDTNAAVSLLKGATFHAALSPSSVNDPTLHIKGLTNRAPTSPKALQDLVNQGDERVAELISQFERSFDGLTTPSDHIFDENKGTVPDAANSKRGIIAATGLVAASKANHHSSESGMDSRATAGGPDTRSGQRERCKAGSPVAQSPPHLTSLLTTRHKARSSSSSSSSTSSTLTSSTTDDQATTITTATAATDASRPGRPGHVLNAFAIDKIREYIIDPIVKEEALKDYHALVQGLPSRIGSRQITCLRDLEKTLIFLAPTTSASPAKYLKFCDASIQHIHTTVRHLNEIDQRRPTDRPYTNNYFLDLVQQVQQYARIMAAAKAKKAKGQQLVDDDYTPDEKLVLSGGPSEGTKRAQLVREKNGKQIPIVDNGPDAPIKIEDDDDEDMDLIIDEDVRRSMARKRKCDQGKEEYRACRECGKLFTRPCDLTKHEKTHSRPWKCSDSDCKYHDLGWPTEKERDRHVNDKHSNAPALYKCLYTPCAYTSKRESNCKQHMEKAHGWTYVRSKSKKGQNLLPTTAQSPVTNLAPTPRSGSAFPNISTPGSGFSGSPSMSSNHNFSDAGSLSDVAIFNHSTSVGFSPIDQTYQNVAGEPSWNYNGLISNGMTFSPIQSDGSLEGFDTPGSVGMSTHNTSMDSGMQELSTFEDEFNFNALHAENPWPPMHEAFPSYRIQMPTPAWSPSENFHQAKDYDFELELQAVAGAQAQPDMVISPGMNADAMLFAPTESQVVDEAFDKFCTTGSDSQGMPRASHGGDDDFTLISDGPAGGESSADGAMFPELNQMSDPFNYGGASKRMFDSDMNHY